MSDDVHKTTVSAPPWTGRPPSAHRWHWLERRQGARLCALWEDGKWPAWKIGRDWVPAAACARDYVYCGPCLARGDGARLVAIERASRDLHALLHARVGMGDDADIQIISRDAEIAAALRERLQRLRDALAVA